MAQVAHLALLPLGPNAGWEWSCCVPQRTLAGNPMLLGPHWLASRPETLRLQAGSRGGPPLCPVASSSSSHCFCVSRGTMSALPDLTLPAADRRVLCWVFFDIALLPNHTVFHFHGHCGLLYVANLVPESRVWEPCLWAIPRSQSGAS